MRADEGWTREVKQNIIRVEDHAVLLSVGAEVFGEERNRRAMFGGFISDHGGSDIFLTSHKNRNVGFYNSGFFPRNTGQVSA